MQLQATAARMQSQIDNLQRERLQLLDRLQKSSTQASEGGIRFVGLSVEHLDKIRSYASALSEGLIPHLMPARENTNHTLKSLTDIRDEQTARISHLEEEPKAV